MLTLLIWSNGDGMPSVYLIEHELLLPYAEARDKMINGDANERESGFLEHLAIMLGEERYKGSIPTLESWMTNEGKRALELPAISKTEDQENTTLPVATPPWADKKITTQKLDMKIYEIFFCGWFM